MATVMRSGVGEQEYMEIVRQPLVAERTALLVIDIQERILAPIFEKDRLVRNSRLLMKAAQVMGVPMLLNTQYEKGLGPTVREIAELAPGAPSVDRRPFGCFEDAGFCAAMKHLPGDRNTLLVCGMESHICCTQTVLGALRAGYIVHVASDAVSSRTEWNWKTGLERMRAAGAVITSTEMAIYELMRASDAPAFKEMLKVLK